MKKAIFLMAFVLSFAFVGTAQARISFQGYTWNVYHQVGHLGQHWSDRNTVIKNGILHEHVRGGTSGGVGMVNHWQTYGTFSVRYRMSHGGGKYAILLIGHTISQHNEIDFAESPYDDAQRLHVTATLHRGRSNQQQHFKRFGHFDRWHTATVIWRPNQITFLMDGRPWAVITKNVPSVPMHLTIQTNVYQVKNPSVLEVSSVHISP